MKVYTVESGDTRGKNSMTRAIVLGGSRGIGKAISNALESIKIDVFSASKKDIDTSNLDSVKKFLEIHNQTDILILNTGGPQPKPFTTIISYGSQNTPHPYVTR